MCLSWLFFRKRLKKKSTDPTKDERPLSCCVSVQQKIHVWRYFCHTFTFKLNRSIDVLLKALTIDRLNRPISSENESVSPSNNNSISSVITSMSNYNYPGYNPGQQFQAPGHFPPSGTAGGSSYNPPPPMQPGQGFAPPPPGQYGQPMPMQPGRGFAPPPMGQGGPPPPGGVGGMNTMGGLNTGMANMNLSGGAPANP